jgi:hypothetical protein
MVLSTGGSDEDLARPTHVKPDGCQLDRTVRVGKLHITVAGGLRQTSTLLTSLHTVLETPFMTECMWHLVNRRTHETKLFSQQFVSRNHILAGPSDLLVSGAQRNTLQPDECSEASSNITTMYPVISCHILSILFPPTSSGFRRTFWLS